jgi:DNA-binding phage protein
LNRGEDYSLPPPAASMSEITREKLHAYLDDALTDAETAQVEQALRGSEPLRRALRLAMQDRDRGDHSLGAVWRRERLTCPSREQLGSYLLQVLDEGQQDYIEFHLKTVACPFCVANLADLQSLQKEPVPQAKERRRRYFQSSAGYLNAARNAHK